MNNLPQSGNPLGTGTGFVQLLQRMLQGVSASGVPAQNAAIQPPAPSPTDDEIAASQQQTADAMAAWQRAYGGAGLNQGVSNYGQDYLQSLIPQLSSYLRMPRLQRLGVSLSSLVQGGAGSQAPVQNAPALPPGQPSTPSQTDDEAIAALQRQINATRAMTLDSLLRGQ